MAVAVGRRNGRIVRWGVRGFARAAAALSIDVLVGETRSSLLSESFRGCIERDHSLVSCRVWQRKA